MGFGEAKDGSAVLKERGASQRFCSDVREVVSGRCFYEEDSAVALGVTYHGVAGGDPFGFGRHAFAAGAVNEDAGVGEHGCGFVGGES